VSAISGVNDGGVIAEFTQGGSVVEQIRLLDPNKDGRYCRNHYFTEPGIYHVDVIVTDREGRTLELKDDAATFVIIERKSSSLIVKARDSRGNAGSGITG
jgi:hypothetical protein